MATRSATRPSESALTDAELAAWRGFLRVHGAVIKQLDAELEAAHGLPISSYEVLLHLDASPGRRMRMRDLADAALLSRSGLSRLVDRLVREGLVQRASCPSDARGAFAVLSDKGAETLARARPTHLDGVRRSFLGRLDSVELAQLAACWERVLRGAAD